MNASGYLCVSQGERDGKEKPKGCSQSHVTQRSLGERQRLRETKAAVSDPDAASPAETFHYFASSK